MYERYVRWRLRQRTWVLAVVTGAMFGVVLGISIGVGTKSASAGLVAGCVTGLLFGGFYPIAMSIQRQRPGRSSSTNGEDDSA